MPEFLNEEQNAIYEREKVRIEEALKEYFREKFADALLPHFDYDEDLVDELVDEAYEDLFPE